jgi:dTDP-4-dehydrorhamnose reductase
MRLFIAGWQGQLASALVAQVPGRDDVSSFAVGRPALDLCEQPTIQRALAGVRPDVIVNAAAYTKVDKAETESETAFALNCEGARMLAEAAAIKGIPIIHISTDYVFAGDLNRPYREDDVTEPHTVYGRSKLAGEQAVCAANQKHIVLRTSWIYSAGGTNFVRSILEKAGNGKPIDVVSDQYGSPTYAPHLASLIIDIALRMMDARDDDPRWGVYHAAGVGETTWFAFAKAIMTGAEANGWPTVEITPIATGDYPTAASRPANSRLNCDKLHATLALRIPSWQEGLANCLDRIEEEPG